MAAREPTRLRYVRYEYISAQIGRQILLRADERILGRNLGLHADVLGTARYPGDPDLDLGNEGVIKAGEPCALQRLHKSVVRSSHFLFNRSWFFNTWIRDYSFSVTASGRSAVFIHSFANVTSV